MREFSGRPDPAGTAHPVCLALSGDGLVLEGEALLRPAGAAEIAAGVYLGLADGEDCYAVRSTEVPTTPLRGFLAALPAIEYSLIALGRSLLLWRERARHCGACGAATEKKPGEHAVVCTACGEIFYPQIAPVVMVAVTDAAGRLLLARNGLFRGNVHSVIAGFVEPGESLEEAVVREVREEVALEVADIRYFASQPWPFPGSLIAAFTARHAGGEIRCDGVEIVEAGWFTAADHPPLPHPGSISRRLIEAVFHGEEG